MGKIAESVDYRGEHLGIRLGPERCQTIIRDYDKRTWSTYGAPDSYPREQKYWVTAAQGCSIVRMAVQVLRNEMPSDLLEILTGKKKFASAAGGALDSVERRSKRQGTAAALGPIL
jgi:hypothetical protein